MDRETQALLHVSLRADGVYEAAFQYIEDTDRLEWTSRFGRITLGNWMYFKHKEKHNRPAFDFTGWITHRENLIASGILGRVHEFERA